MPQQLSPDDAIAKLRSLPEDQQRLVLSRLDPDARKGILAKLTPAGVQGVAQKDVDSPSYWDVLTNPVGSGVKQGIIGGAEQIGGQAIKTMAAPMLHPVDTAVGMLKTGAALSPVLAPFVPKEWNPIESQVEQFKADKAQGGVPLAIENLAGTIAGTVEGGRVTGAAGEKFVGPATRALMEKARNTTQSLVGAGERPVKAAVAKEAESSNAEIEKTRQQNKTADEKTLEARGKVEAENKAAREKALAKNREAEASHKAATDKAKAENQKTLEARDKRATAQKKLDEASSEMRARIETSREKALKVGNQKYSAVNESLNHLPADMESIHDSLADATGKIKGSDTEPAILKNIAKKVEQGEALTYEDEQGFYSELGNELSKGTLPGDVYTAYDTMHEAIGNDMQRIADSQGKGSQLLDARNYWRRMKQTFGKPLGQTDNATASLKKANPDFIPSDEQANRLRLLGSFDPEIPKAAQGVENLRKGLDALGSEKPLRAEVTPLPEKPSPVKPETKPYEEPNPTKPIERPEVNTREIREKLVDKWTTGESSLNKWQVRALLSSGIGSIIGLAVGGGAEGLEAAGAATGLTYAFGPAVIARILENPAVREWLSRPPKGEIDTLNHLPHADQIRIIDSLRPVVQEAERTGVKVDPLIVALTGSSFLGPKTQQLQQMRANQ